MEGSELREAAPRIAACRTGQLTTPSLPLMLPMYQ